jgi:outer membrane lipoprotein-sorting protein
MRRSIFVLLLALGSAPAQENAAVPVVKAAIEAHGGAEALATARTARMSGTGTTTMAGQDIKFTATFAYALPEKYRIDLNIEHNGLKMVATQILNGKKVKISTKQNGTETPVDPKMKEEAIQSVLYEEMRSLTPLLDAKRYTLKLEKDADINGNPASVVNVTTTGIKDVRLFFDKKSNRLVKTQRRGLGRGATGIIEVDEEAYFSDFKPFGKATLPAAMLVNHDGKKYMSMTVTELKFVDKIDDKEFATD